MKNASVAALACDAKMKGELMIDKNDQQYQELVDEHSSELFCDLCGHYPIEPMHGHFVCPACKMPTKCCEGIPAEI